MINNHIIDDQLKNHGQYNTILWLYILVLNSFIDKMFIDANFNQEIWEVL